MKFTDYLDQLKSTKLSPQDKELIFARFEAKKRQGLFINKVRSFTRVATLSLLAATIFGLFYFGNFGPGDIGEREVNDGFIAFNTDTKQPITFADEIGTIIQTVGDVQIFADGVTKESSSLANNDKVLLLEGAELTFSVQDGVQAKILGPAEFKLEKIGEQYTINMLAGEFVELKSIEPEPTLTDREFVTNKPNPAPKKPEPVKVIVKTPEFEVTSDTSDGEIDMTITEKEGKPVVENTGVDVVIVKTIKDKKVVTELKTLQTAAINGEVSISDIVVADPQLALNDEQAEELTATLKDDLSITYKIDSGLNQEGPTEPNAEGPTEPKEGQEDSGLNQESPDGSLQVGQADVPAKAGRVVDTGVSAPVAKEAPKPEAPKAQQAPAQRVLQDEKKIEENPAEVIIEGKRVIDGPNLQALQSATNTSVIMRDIRNIVTSHAHGNTSAVSISLNNLANSLGPVSNQILGGMYLDRSSPAAMANAVQALISNLENKWLVPPVYINKLKGTVAWLRLIGTISPGAVDSTCDFNCIVDEVLQIPTSQKGYMML